MRLLIIVLILLYGAGSYARDGNVGVLLEEGYITNVDSPQYSSVGLFYLSSGKVKLGLKYMNLASGYSDMYSLSATKLTSLNRKGLYSLVGVEALGLDHKSHSYPGMSRYAPVFGMGVFLTRRKFLSQVELSVRYPRVEFNFSVGY